MTRSKYENRVVVTPWQVLPNATGYEAFQGVGLGVVERHGTKELEIDLNRNMADEASAGVADAAGVRRGHIPSWPALRFGRTAQQALADERRVDQFTLPERAIMRPHQYLATSAAELVYTDHMYSSIGDIALINIVHTSYEDAAASRASIDRLGSNRKISGPFGYYIVGQYFMVAFLHAGDEIVTTHRGVESTVAYDPEAGGLIVYGNEDTV